MSRFHSPTIQSCPVIYEIPFRLSMYEPGIPPELKQISWISIPWLPLVMNGITNGCHTTVLIFNGDPRNQSLGNIVECPRPRKHSHLLARSKPPLNRRSTTVMRIGERRGLLLSFSSSVCLSFWSLGGFLSVSGMLQRQLGRPWNVREVKRPWSLEDRVSWCRDAAKFNTRRNFFVDLLASSQRLDCD